MIASIAQGTSYCNPFLNELPCGLGLFQQDKHLAQRHKVVCNTLRVLILAIQRQTCFQMNARRCGVAPLSRKPPQLPESPVGL